MAQWKGVGAYVRDLNGKQGSHPQAENSSPSLLNSQVTNYNLSAYQRNWSRPPNTGAMAPSHPSNGPFPGGFTPSPLDSSHPVAQPRSRELETVSTPATISASANNKYNPMSAARLHWQDSHPRTPYRSSRGQKDTVQRAATSAPAPNNTPAAASTYAPVPTSSKTGLKRRSRYALKRIAHLEGEVATIPGELLRQFQQIARANKNSLLPFAKSLWKPSTNTTAQYLDGSLRRWVSFPAEEEIKVGRFTYGATHQIILAQATEGDGWENGKIVVITCAGSISVGSNGTLWKVWRGQDLDATASVRCAPRSQSGVQGSAQQLLPRGPTLGQVDGSNTVEMTQHSDMLLASDVSRGVQDAVVSTSSSPIGELPKRGREGSSSPDSDTPIAAYKRTRRAKVSANSAMRSAASRQSPELGSSDVIQLPEQHTSVNAPPISPLTTTMTGDRPRHTLIATPSRGGVSSPSSAIPVIIEIKDEDRSPSPDNHFDIGDARLLFINSQGSVVRERDFKSCNSIIRLFRAADGANVINSDIDKLTVTIMGKVEQMELNVVRDFEEDFDQMKAFVTKLRAVEVSIARGTMKIE